MIGASDGFAERLRKAKDKAGLTYRALADTSGVTTETLRMWLTQGQVPRIDMAERVAAALDVAPAWLAYGHVCKRNR